MIECKKILIPTFLPEPDVSGVVRKIKETVSSDVEIFCSCQKASASCNRNYAIKMSNLQIGEVAVMLDDDIDGFYPGWLEEIVVPMSDPDTVMASARLLKADGVTFGETCSQCHQGSPNAIEIKRHGDCLIPTAAISFRFTGLLYDESFLGSGWEDNDMCLQYIKQNPAAKFWQLNSPKLIHYNEMKLQKGDYWNHNVAHFKRKWYGR